MDFARQILIAVITLAVCGCVGNIYPPLPYEPVLDGTTAEVHFEIARGSGGAEADPWSHWLLPEAGRIYSITLHLYQYEDCKKQERGTVVLKRSRPVDTRMFKANALLFVEVLFNGSEGVGHADLVIRLEENAEYTVSTVYEHHTPKRFRMAADQNLRKDGKAMRISVTTLTYRTGLLAAMLNCRDQEQPQPARSPSAIR